MVYNFALTLFFVSLTQIFTGYLTTTFYLYNFPQGSFLSKIVMVALLSMAGVPPFIGFFSKVSIFAILVNSSLFLLFPVFFILLFTGLYFYLQNLRLLLTSTNQLDAKFFYVTELQTRFATQIFLLGYFLLIILLFGIVFIEDLLLYSS